MTNFSCLTQYNSNIIAGVWPLLYSNNFSHILILDDFLILMIIDHLGLKPKLLLYLAAELIIMNAR